MNSEKQSHSTAQANVLDAAEQEFMLHGYKPVTLDAIAKRIGIRKASLYHHAPGGKEELFMSVIARCMERHESALSRIVEENLQAAGTRDTLIKIGLWFLSQPPMHTTRLLSTDLPLLKKENAHHLRVLLDKCVVEPVATVFMQALKDGQLRGEPRMLMGLYFNLMESMHQAHLYTDKPMEALLEQVVDIYMFGAFKN